MPNSVLLGSLLQYRSYVENMLLVLNRTLKICLYLHFPEKTCVRFSLQKKMECIVMYWHSFQFERYTIVYPNVTFLFSGSFV